LLKQQPSKTYINNLDILSKGGKMTASVRIFKILFTFSILISSSLFSQTFSWSVLPNSPTGGRFDDVYFINENTGWTADGRVFKTTNGGSNWMLMNQQTYVARSIGFFDENTGIGGTLDSNVSISRTTDGGSTWTMISGNLPHPRPSGVCGISIVDQNIAYFCGAYFGGGRAYKTTDKGISWTLAFNDTSLARTLIDCYFWSPDSGIIVGGYNTSTYNSGNAVILLTTNGGKSWQRVYRAFRTGEWCWKISFISKNIGYVSIQKPGVSQFFLKTTNGGFNWAEIPFGYDDEQAIGFINENSGWIGAYQNFCFETTNGGISWNSVNWGASLNRIRRINDTLAFASGRRIYKYSRLQVGINPILSEVPINYKLSQNYPNPFNPETTINFELPIMDFVILKIFDVSGRGVATIVNEVKEAGYHSVSFDARNLSSGMYFYQLITEKYLEVKKMVLIK
jgi:photosystem II stability/assembly factor-like uncharacterized protein